MVRPIALLARHCGNPDGLVRRGFERNMGRGRAELVTGIEYPGCLNPISP
jgi:hypothetical protein